MNSDGVVCIKVTARCIVGLMGKSKEIRVCGDSRNRFSTMMSIAPEANASRTSITNGSNDGGDDTNITSVRSTSSRCLKYVKYDEYLQGVSTATTHFNDMTFGMNDLHVTPITFGSPVVPEVSAQNKSLDDFCKSVDRASNGINLNGNKRSFGNVITTTSLSKIFIWLVEIG